MTRHTGQAQGTLGWPHQWLLTFGCKSSRVEECADVRKAQVDLYHLVNMSHIMWEGGTDWSYAAILLWIFIWTKKKSGLSFFTRFERQQCCLKSGPIEVFAICTIFSSVLYKPCMWDICWIKRAACITKGPREDPASICLHRTLSPLHSTPTLPDTIMCQTWKRTHSLRAAGAQHTGPRERTGAHIV